ncbi:MAG: DNA polymerase I [Crocinitomicaceae bacterium]|nr:DNA polymerase I [Crocinitomicaceae bacterium]
MITKDTDKKLFLLDAFALIFRAYYAFIRSPRINSKGLNTSAMFGFTNTLLDILKNEKPSHIAVVFDAPEQTLREIDYEAYKANRDETPEDIILSVPWIKKIIESFNIPMLEKGGYEADDVIGTLAKIAEKEGFVIYMMTSDKDYGQLVSDNIFIYKPGYQGGVAEVLGTPQVLEKFGIERVDQVIDVLGMMGDTVDNIPGIPGVGEKTAIKLIKEFGSLEGLLENTNKLKGKQKENVENFRDQAILSKKLATILLDAPVSFDEKSLRVEEPNRDMLREVFAELEFRQLAKRVLNEDLAPAEPIQGELFASDLFVQTSEKEGEIDNNADLKTIADIPHHYELVETEKEIGEILKKLREANEFCFDTETSDIEPINAILVGLSFSIKPHEAWYVAIPHDIKEGKKRMQLFKEIFEDESKLLIGQNYKYDFKMLKKYGIEVKNKIFDTMVAHYLINPDGRHSMDYLAEVYLGYSPVPIETLIGKKGKTQGTMADLSPAEIKDYAAEDADITLQLKEKLEPELIKGEIKKIFDDVEIPLIEVLASMELEGVRIDEPFLNNYSSELEIDIQKIEKEIHDLAGAIFNIDSPKQLGVILFDKLKITDQVKKTKTGQYSTGEDVLLKFSNDHAIIPKILDYRELRKLKSTYVDSLPAMVNQYTGRIHTNYMQTVAATGRLSSNNPNLQNIPIRTSRGREIRKAFIPRREGYTILSADYSQVELRIIAALSNDRNMCEAFFHGEDIHAATAAKVFGVPIKGVDKSMRSKAKAVNFGIIYGQGAFGLAQNLGISRGEAKEIIDSYFKQFSSLKTYQQENIEQARKNGYVQTILGRRRYLPDINSSNAVVRGFAERNAINAPIQGSAADIIKVAMINIHHSMKEKGLRSKMIMQVHDELVFDAYINELSDLKELVKNLMVGAVKMRVPLEVEMNTGDNWLEAH